MQSLRRWVDGLRNSPWWPLLVRAAIWMAAFVALARIGRGAFEELAVPPAEAAATPQRTAERRAQPRERPPAPPAPCPSSSPEASGVTADGKVILNTASPRDLTRLPGVGPKRAEAIVALRARLGRFRTVRDLLRVKGIGRRSLARIEPLVVLDPPPPPEDEKAEE